MMPLIWRLTVLLLVVASILSCSRDSSETANDGAPGSNIASGDPSVAADTSATTTGSTGGTVSALSPADKEFVMKAAQVNFAEVQMGLMAGRNTSTPDVRNFGRLMVRDHGKGIEDLRKLVTMKGLALPSESDAPHIEAARHLSGLNGREFDRMYLSHMVEGHEKSIGDFDQASRTAGDADVKAFAAAKLPMLQEHLRLAREAQRKLR